MREWQWVTVALALSSSWASGLPTRIERPSTTARAPDSSTPASSSSPMTPAGVHGTSASSRPCMSRPALVGGEAVHVLGGIDQRDELVLVEVVRQGQLQQDAVDALVVVEGADQPRELLGCHVRPGLVMERLDAHLGRVLALHPHVDGRGRVVAHEDRGEARAPAELGHLARDLRLARAPPPPCRR